MNAADVMTSPVVSIGPDASLRQVAALLSERRISGMPVVEGDQLVGLVSEADLLRRRTGAQARRVRDVMTHEVMTVSADTPVVKVAALLEGYGIKRVPVVQAGRLVGIVSRSNLVQALAIEEERDEAGSDPDLVVTEGVVAPAPPASAKPAAQVRRASARGHSRHGWVDSWHSFSFGNYYDSAHMGYGPLRAINEKLVQPGKGSTTYGLRDAEVLAYVLEGALGHDDSMDNSATLLAGGVQCLSAGSGARFSETNRGEAPTRFLQIWMESQRAGLPAAYAHAQFPRDAKRGRLRPIASPDGREGSLRMNQDALLYAGLFDGAERAQLELAPGRLAYVHVARGAISVNGQALEAGDGLVSIERSVSLQAARDAEVLVFDLPERAAAAGY